MNDEIQANKETQTHGTMQRQSRGSESDIYEGCRLVRVGVYEGEDRRMFVIGISIL